MTSTENNMVSLALDNKSSLFPPHSFSYTTHSGEIQLPYCEDTLAALLAELHNQDLGHPANCPISESSWKLLMAISQIDLFPAAFLET